MSDAAGERLNQYTCQECGFTVTTIERVEGVTPMILGSHRFVLSLMRDTGACRGQMMSHWYRVEGSPAPDLEWFKPESTKGYSAEMKQHIRDGGLVIRRAK